MEKEELRLLCKPLMELNSIENCQLLLEKYIDFIFAVIRKHHYENVDTQAKADSKIIFQMFFTKAINIRKTLEGLEYDNGKYKLNGIIDPTILYALVRSVFEALCAFELVYMIPDTEDKKRIMYNLYKLSGLKYRQRFNDSSATPDMQKKYNAELAEINESIDIIKNTALYRTLSLKNKEKIDRAIKDKSYQLMIDSSNKVKLYGWGDVPALFGAQHSLLKNAYTLFSLNAHPSYVSMFQFRDMFPKNNPEYIQISLSAMYYCFVFFSIFIADYIKLFPTVRDTYASLSNVDQILLNFHNKLIRGENYSIILVRK